MELRVCCDPAVKGFDFMEGVGQVEKDDVWGGLGEDLLCLLDGGGGLGCDHALSKLGLQRFGGLRIALKNKESIHPCSPNVWS